MAPAARSPGSGGERSGQHDGKGPGQAVVGSQLAPDRPLVGGGRPSVSVSGAFGGRSGASVLALGAVGGYFGVSVSVFVAGVVDGGDHRLSRQTAGYQRLADALAGHRVGGRGRVPGEQSPGPGEGDPADPGRNGPGPVGGLGLGVGPQHPAQVGAGQQIRPDPAHVADPEAAVPADAEADVGPAAGQRERPGVGGQQVGFKPHEHLLGRLGSHVAEVLAEGVPLAPIARRVAAERLAEGRPHAVGADGPAGGDRAQALDVGRDRPAAVGHGSAGQPAAVGHPGPRGPGQLHKGGVEIGAPSHRRVGPVGGQGEGPLPARGRADRGRGHRPPRRRRLRGEPDPLQLPQSQGGEAVAAALVPGEGGPVHHQGVQTGPGSVDGGGGSGRPGPHHQQIDLLPRLQTLRTRFARFFICFSEQRLSS